MGIVTDRPVVADMFERLGLVVHLRDVDAAGVPRAMFRRECDRGFLVRVAKASFVRRSDWVDAGPWERFRLRAIGFGQCTGPEIFLTGWAAAVLLGLPTVGEPPPLPVALRSGNPRTGTSITPYGRIRVGHLPVHQRWHRHGVGVVGSASAVVDVARRAGPTAGLVVADAALASGVERESIAALAQQMSLYPGIAVARWVIENADGRSESPLETLGRLAFLTSGRTPPLSNVWIRAGGRWFRVDHLLPAEGVVLEADGALKYNDRPDAARIVADQVERERLLRSVGLVVVRYTASQVRSDPRGLLRRVDAEIRVRGLRPFADWSWFGLGPQSAPQPAHQPSPGPARVNVAEMGLLGQEQPFSRAQGRR
jgi:hypothetical protein